MSLLTAVPRDIWYIISKFLTFEEIILINLFYKTPYPESSYVFREFYEQEIGGKAKENYKQEIIKILKEIENLSSNDLLCYACKRGYLNLVKTSISNVQFNHSHNIELRSAVRHGHLEIIQYLFEFDPKGLKFDYPSALITAALHGHLDIVRYLVGVGIKDKNYWALSAAVREGHLDIVRYLVGLDSKDPGGFKVADYFALRFVEKNLQPEILEYLLSEGVKISFIDNEEQRFIY